MLADVVGQDVHCGAVAGDQGLESAAGAHRAELAVVADEHHLGLGRGSRRQDLQQRPVVGHGRLIEDDDVAVTENELAAFQSPGERRQGA